MTEEQLNKLLIAQSEGKTIQVQMINGEWRDVFVSALDSKCDFSFYRIKPDDTAIAFFPNESCYKCGKKLTLENMADIILASNPPKYMCKECAGERPKLNYTIEQNCGENRVEGGVLSISGSVAKQYRPFKDCDELVECWERKIFIPAMRYTKQKVLFRPEIWVKSKEYGTDNLITAFDGDNESIGGSCVFIQDIWVDMKELFEHYTFLDGSPVGKEE